MPSIPIDSAASPPSRAGASAGLGFLIVAALILASIPSQNLDLWGHLAAGRDVLQGQLSAAGATTLYDLAGYLAYSAGGGWLLAASKAIVVAGVAIVLFGIARRRAGAVLTTCCVGLALLAVAHRVPLQPVTVSYLFLALAFSLAIRSTESDRPRTVWPGWSLVVLVLIWTNTDRWVVLGLATIALVWFGQAFEAAGSLRQLIRRFGSLAILAAAAVVSPIHVRALVPPAELFELFAEAVEGSAIPISPFGRVYLASFQECPAARAYFALLILSAYSFYRNRSRWSWDRALPWLGLAVVSAGQARAIPFFAIVAGPMMAWNFAEIVAQRPPSARSRCWAIVGAVLAGVVLLVCAWPGWLQGPPYGPRRWDVKPPVAVASAARDLSELRSSGRVLVSSPEVVGALAWFGSGEAPTVDPTLIAAIAGSPAESRDRLRSAGVEIVMVTLAARGQSVPLLERILTAPDEWPMLRLGSGYAIFGWRDPQQGGPDPFRGREIDFERVAFAPTDAEQAPAAPPTAIDRQWWESLWRRAPDRSADRDELTMLMLKLEAERLTAPIRHARAWEAWQAASFVGAGGACPGPVAPALALRLNLFSPVLPPENVDPPPLTRTALDIQRQFVAARGDLRPSLLTAAIRSARRCIVDDPTDAGPYLALGQCYLRLLDSTRERDGAARFPLLGQLRQVQASAALNRAVALNPSLAAAHLELGLLYRRMSCGDLAVNHLKTYRELTARAGGIFDPRASGEVMERLSQLLDRHAKSLAEESRRVSTAERAQMAVKRGLAGEALRLLLESDVAAFGANGMRLELDLLLKTGRVDDLLNWTTTDLRESLGSGTYHWLRAQSHFARGDYFAADLELSSVVGRPQRPAEAGAAAARIAGKAVLDSAPGTGMLPDLLWRSIAQNDHRAEVLGFEQNLTNQCDVAAVRGLIALEAGDIDRARNAFRDAQAFASPKGQAGGFSYPAQFLAVEGLESILRIPARGDP